MWFKEVSKSLWELGIQIDRVFNAFGGGRASTTISARVGYLVHKKGVASVKPLRHVIDFTFFPVDGKYHCLQAYRKHPSVHIQGNAVALAVTYLFAVAGCMVLAPFLYLAGLVKLFR